MCDLAKRKNLVLTLGYMYRYNPGIIEAKRLLQEGKLGEILSVDAHMGACYNNDDMRRDVGRFKGGMTFYLGCHLIDIVTYFLGYPKEIVPLNGKSMLNGVDCVDTGFVAFKYDKATSFIRTSAVEVNAAARRQITISGTEGTISLLPVEKSIENGYNECAYKVTISKENTWNDNSTTYTQTFRRYEKLLLDFASFVRGEKKNPYTYDYEKQLHEIVLKACEIL